MGTPLPPNQIGDDCVLCWGFEKPFGNGNTPRIIQLRLTDLSPGQFWDPADEQLLLTPHFLQQHPVPCTYTIDDGRFLWEWVWGVGTTQIDVVRKDDFKSVFAYGSRFECDLFLPNWHQAPVGVVAYYGWALVTWSLEGL